MAAMRSPWMQLDKEFIREYIQTHTVVYGDKKCWLLTTATGNTFRYPRRMIDGVYYAVAGLTLWAAGRVEHPIPSKVQGKGGLSADDDLFLHHCDGGELGCVRPDHIYIDDQEENMQGCVRRGRHFQAAKEFCKQGHPLNDPLIGRRYKNSPNRRACLACKRDSERRIHNRPESAWDGPSIYKMAITKEQLIAAVEACGGDKEKAGPTLGITISSFYRKWHQFGLEVKDRSEWRGGRTPYRDTITQCKRGHEFTEENTVYASDGSGRRGCRICLREWKRNKVKPKADARRRWNELADEIIPLAIWLGNGNSTETSNLVGLPRTTFERKGRELKPEQLSVTPASRKQAEQRLKALREEMLQNYSTWKSLVKKAA